jgi:hypothetical protein
LEQEGVNELYVAMFRCVLALCLYEYEPEVTSKAFTQDLVLQTLSSVPGLRRLCLPVENHIIRSEQVATSMHHLKDLEVFIYMYHCTDQVVIQLGLNCTNLTEVNFHHSFMVTNNCVPHLLRLSNLQYLYLEGTSVDTKHYGMLLSQLPKIADLRIPRPSDDILKHITLKAVNTITDVYGHVRDIKLLIKKCPNTRKFVVAFSVIDLSGVTAWNNLRSLEISFNDCAQIKLNAILTGVGRKLTDLKLVKVHNLDFQNIITLCPSLKNLALLMCQTLPPNADTPLNTQLLHFKNLISLQIEKFFTDRTDYSYIQNYVNLEKIDLFRIDIFTDEFMSEVVRRGTLANLEECYITETMDGAMTFEVLRQFIQYCSHLKVFGHTDSLPRLEQENIEELKREMLLGNFDIDIMS